MKYYDVIGKKEWERQEQCDKIYYSNWFKEITNNYKNGTYSYEYNKVDLYYNNEKDRNRAEEILKRRNIAFSIYADRIENNVIIYSLKIHYNSKEKRPNRANPRKQLELGE